jgi:hypothetical protein
MTYPVVQRLADEAAIRRLAAYYSDAVTHLDAARAASVYAVDGLVAIAGHEIAGRGAIESGMRETFGQFSLLQLIEHGGLVEISGNEAMARWSTVELAVRQGAKALGVIFGRYEDQLVRLPEGWRFKRRSFTLAGRTQIESTKLQLNSDFFSSLTSLLQP